MLFKPFKALRPLKKFAGDVIAPPYDVLNTDEAYEAAHDKPLSFLHISKPEIDLEKGVNPYSKEVYAKAKQNLDTLIKDGVLIQDEKDGYYVYKITMGTHIQTGIAGLASNAAYKDKTIKEHEFTLPIKEDDRFNQIKTLMAQTGPIILTYEESSKIAEFIAKTVKSEPSYKAIGPNETNHEIWVIDNKDEVELLGKAFTEVGELFIADGHHRIAAGSRVADDLSSSSPDKAEQYDGILAVAFSNNEMQVLPYNRVIKDLNGLSVEKLIEEIKKAGFSIEKEDHAVVPDKKRNFGMYVDGNWYHLNYQKAVDETNAIKKLDVSILSDNLFNAILGIKDLRTDKRIAFIGGIRGVEELQNLVDKGDFKVAFSMFHTPISDMIDVARVGEVMPPKSTWFEPKLADGLLSNKF